ncbi:YibE/F family protein [uncultured Cetobacterium sp.]|uniref:YibE/F family protein n=1 Tax=uncultured Cetobacterium sp. TaxID=527638 RepID=UPI00260D2EE4|nr:YibE/F family protein [uncultured Cetobacterium sp.]
MKKIIFLLLLISTVVYSNDLKNLKNFYHEEVTEREYTVVRAKILSIPYDDVGEKRDIPIESDIRYQHVKIKLLNGDFKGEIFTLRNTIDQINPYKLILKKGEDILLYQYEKNGKLEGLKIFERSKERPLFAMICAFIFFMVLIGGKKGFKAFITLLLTVLCVIFILIPLILRGYSPIPMTILCVVGITVMTIFMVGGINRKSYAGILGTILGTLIAGALAVWVSNYSNLVGMGSEDMQALVYGSNGKFLNYRGILFSGIIIGALGAIMDVAISISSSMWEIESLNKDISNYQLAKSGMNIGKDIMGAMSNTLILAYVGSSLSLILVFMSYKLSFYEIINLDMVATEIIRSIAGSIGLVLSIPATILVVILLRKKNSRG